MARRRRRNNFYRNIAIAAGAAGALGMVVVLASRSGFSDKQFPAQITNVVGAASVAPESPYPVTMSFYPAARTNGSGIADYQVVHQYTSVSLEASQTVFAPKFAVPGGPLPDPNAIATVELELQSPAEVADDWLLSIYLISLPNGQPIPDLEAKFAAGTLEIDDADIHFFAVASTGG